MNLWLQPVVAIAVPALLIAAVPQRWVKRAVILWLLSPLIVFVGIVIWEAATRPATPNALGTAFYGLMLISSILAIPWLVACLIGFGIGFGLRRMLRPRPADVQAPAIPVPPAAATRPKPAWRDVHVGFANDGLMIGGLDVWASKWWPASSPPVSLPHPAHPHQMHSYDVYTINDERYQVRFAAAELSNGVWGFYVPA